MFYFPRLLTRTWPNCVERQVASECIWVLVGKIVQYYREVLKRWTPIVTDQNPHTCFSDKPAKFSSSHIWAIVPSLALNWLSMQHTKFDKMWGTLFWVGTQGCSQELKGQSLVVGTMVTRCKCLSGQFTMGAKESLALKKRREKEMHWNYLAEIFYLEARIYRASLLKPAMRMWRKEETEGRTEIIWPRLPSCAGVLGSWIAPLLDSLSVTKLNNPFFLAAFSSPPSFTAATTVQPPLRRTLRQHTGGAGVEPRRDSTTVPGWRQTAEDSTVQEEIWPAIGVSSLHFFSFSSSLLPQLLSLRFSWRSSPVLSNSSSSSFYFSDIDFLLSLSLSLSLSQSPILKIVQLLKANCGIVFILLQRT